MQLPCFMVRKAAKKNQKGGAYVYSVNTSSYKSLEFWFPTVEQADSYASDLNLANIPAEMLGAKVMCECGKAWLDHLYDGFGTAEVPCRQFKLRTLPEMDTWIAEQIKLRYPVFEECSTLIGEQDCLERNEQFPCASCAIFAYLQDQYNKLYNK